MQQPLISVIVTCFNHGHYLTEAINSIIAQSYKPVEIVVVDDGSKDNTREVAVRYPSVKYIYQVNQGVSAARNTGIDHSSGEYISFLDADDLLLPEALNFNYQLLSKHVEAAFVSGGFKVEKANKEIIKMQTVVESDHFCRLLEFNYISMIATVLFRRWVFNDFRFDTTLTVCEDYELYLNIARKYPILHHTEFNAVYRFHAANTSYNTVRMMSSALEILRKQKPRLLNKQESASWAKGVEENRIFYSKVIYAKYFLPEQKYNLNRRAEMHALWKNSKSLYIRFYLKKIFHVFKNFFKKSSSWIYFKGVA